MRLIALLAGLLATGSLHAESYDFGPGEGSRFALEVFKTGLMSGKKHVFVFERFSGEAASEAKVRFTIESGSVTCTDEWINEGSRKKVQDTARNQMMQADSFPHLTFTSSKVVAKNDNRYDVEGMLTIRDKTHPVTVHVSMKESVFDGAASVRLSDFGLKPPKGVTLGLIGTKDEMSVVFHLVGKRKTAAIE